MCSSDLDDASIFGGECAADGNRSQVVAALDPGTYYLVLSGYGGQSGTAAINFQHLPMGNLAPVYVGTMGAGAAFTFRSSTSGTGNLAPTATCSANGPEVSYWWRHCSSFSRYSLAASTCNAGSNFDTVLYYRNAASTADVCNDDLNTSCATLGTLSSIGAFVGGGSGIHAVTVDGFAASSIGNYVLTLNGASIIASRTPAPGVCGPRAPLPRRLRATGDPRRAPAL